MDRQALLKQFRAVRATTRNLCDPLSVGDYEPQAMDDCSPIKWHLGHTAWFFETFVLRPFESDFRLFHPKYPFLFNSYYNAEGERHARPERGLLSRPPLDEVLAYRHSVEERVVGLIRSTKEHEVLRRVLLGCHHEQQHQELMLTDVKYLFSRNPLLPAYEAEPDRTFSQPRNGSYPSWFQMPEGLYDVGCAEGGASVAKVPACTLSFAYDNESPRHRVFLERYALARDVVTNGEFLRFIEEGGYRRPEFWLDAGYRHVLEQGWEAPLYWRFNDKERSEFTLQGERTLNLEEPVCHVSYFEADAYARWAGARLPREAEWEAAVQRVNDETPELMSSAVHKTNLPRHPQPCSTAPLSHVFGGVWQWTQSAYCAYPGYRATEGALGEYNGKFMCGQFVLRGGSCATSPCHSRSTYRNFFYPPDRWQFSGIRLARDL